MATASPARHPPLPERFREWRPTILGTLKRLQGSVHDQPHTRKLDRWGKLVREGDISGLRSIMTGLDTDSIEMREVSPMDGYYPRTNAPMSSDW